MCKARLLGAWIKRRKTANGARKIRSEKPNYHHYTERYVRSLESKRIDRDGEANVEHIWGQVKPAIVNVQSIFASL